MSTASITIVCLAIVALCANAKVVSKQGSTPTVTLSVTQPPVFLHHVDVHLHWELSGGDFQEGNDWVSVWWAPFAAAYIEYANVTANSGTTMFTLLNARHPYFFRYYRGNTVLAETKNLVFPDGTFPMQVRTTFVEGEPTHVKVMWTSNRTLFNNTVVQYGTGRGRLTNTVAATRQVSYSHQELNTKVGLPFIPIRNTSFTNIALRDLRCEWGTCYNDFTATQLYVNPGIFHIAEIKGLKPNTKYYFRVGEVGGHMSTIRYFRSRVAPGSDDTLNVMYVADAGAGYQTKGFRGSASHNALPVPPAFSIEGAQYVWDAYKADPKAPEDHASIMNGDISYARGWPFVWELFANETEDIFGQAPVMAIYGNHEFDWAENPYHYLRGPDSGGECGIPTARRFDFKSEDEPWYHMSMGPATFIALSSEQSVTQQRIWLQKILPTIDKNLTPWTIVFLHRPLYESNTWYNPEQVNDMVYGYADIFSKYNIDLVLSGHAHYYERMCEISNGVCNTWGFRDVWTEYANAKHPNYAKCGTEVKNTTLYECRTMCAKQDNCTGVYLKDEHKSCYILTCTDLDNLEYREYRNTWKISREKGHSPVYVVDGTAGGVFTPVKTPYSPLTEYKDFERWGYSRLTITKSTLHWKHYHVDGQIYDNVTLTK